MARWLTQSGGHCCLPKHAVASVTEKFFDERTGFLLDCILYLLLSLVLQNLLRNARHIHFASGAAFRDQITRAVDRPINTRIALIDETEWTHLCDLVIDLAFHTETEIHGRKIDVTGTFHDHARRREAQLFDISHAFIEVDREGEICDGCVGG